MKVEFWKHKSDLFIGGSIFTILSFSLSLTGIILTTKNVIFWPLIMAGILCLTIMIYIFFFQKRILSKVVFSEEGVEWRWLNKEINFLNWTDITEIKAQPRGRGAEDLCFVAGTQQINVGLTKKMYNAIMSICPHPNLKMMINNIEAFKYLHRKK